MKLPLTSLLIVCLLGFQAVRGGTPQGGPPPPPAPARPTKMVGKAAVYYSQKSDASEVHVQQSIYHEKTDTRLESLGLQARFRVKGRKINAPETVTLDFIRQTFDPKFGTPEGRTLTITADGDKLGTGEMSVVNSIKWETGNYTEWIAAQFDLTTFKKIAGAKKVEMRLGKIQFELTDERLEPLRDLLRAIEQ